MKKGKLILINGVSSSGKTTLAKKILCKHPALFHVDPDMFLDMAGEFESEGETESYREFESLYAMFEAISVLLTRGNNVIVDDVMINQNGKNRFFDYCLKYYEYDVLTINIQCSLKTLKRRELIRGDRKIGTAEKQFACTDNDIVYDVTIDSNSSSLIELDDALVSFLEANKKFSAFKQNCMKCSLEAKCCGIGIM